MDLQTATNAAPRLGLTARLAAVACFLLAAALLTFGRSDRLPVHGSVNDFTAQSALPAPHMP